MAAGSVFFRDLAFVFVAAVAGGAGARFTGQPPVLGYVLGGILISPLTPGPAVSDLHTFELFAEIGVILLMFSIGIEFSLRDLRRVRWVALLGGPLGIALSVGIGLGAALLLGWPLLQGAIVGIVVSVASTMVLARLLVDRGELHTRHGRVTIGITLVEDLAVVVLIVLIPALGTLEPGRLLATAGALGRSLLILIPSGYVAAKVIPPLMTRVARMQSDEMFLLVTLAVGVGTAALTQAAGLSLALGAFLAGLVVNGSEYAHETLAWLLPLRDVFVALFFVTIGALIDPSSLVANVPLLATMVVMVVPGKLLLWTGVVWLFRQSFQTALLVGVGLTQIGEFSFVLVQVAPDVVRGLRSRDVPCLFGDAALSRLLEEAGTRRAALAVALPETDRAHRVVRSVRALSPRVPILAGSRGLRPRPARARGSHRGDRARAGGGAALIRHALRQLALPPARVLDYLTRFRGAMSPAALAAGAGSGPAGVLPEVREILLGAGALADLSLGEVRVRERFGVTVVSVERSDGSAVMNPSADTRLRAGDRLRVFGLPDQIDAFRVAAGL